MKNFYLLNIAFLFMISIGFSQERKITKSGTITFEASVPSFEEVKATNNSVSCILNTNTGELASLALVKGFRFKVALMEEHFNENYIESNKYPKATFKGTIKNFNLMSLSTDVPKTLVLNGILSIHGKTKEITTSVTLKKIKNDIELQSQFIVTPSDFDIHIPKVVSKKVAETVTIKIDFLLK
ncbi:YceI family protein [Flavobacterium sp. NG2]|uniref:YceI family protein n=1 Tax=Flavobacterium sp. NG2 TaxID=3097547 RepID=UPI002A80A05F|nr:YceI family protein [Flavobacterium sp. NG2]WPR71048.1 YceI family protein [Flavobacterium sp. NG2]